MSSLLSPKEERKSIIVDACISRNVVEKLREAGIDVLYINETYNPSMSDNEIMAIGYALKEPIFTHDHDFDYFDNAIILPSKKNHEKTFKAILKYLM